MDRSAELVPSRHDRILTGHGGSPPGAGPFISLQLSLAGDRIQKATYESYPCPGGQACGKAVCELVAGRTLKEAACLRHAELVDQVGPLPRHRRIAYGLALLALQDALSKANKSSFT